MDKKEFKILSIDGGGIKGLYSATILKHFEEQYKCKICDYFDMICGTSTGGIIALGLAGCISAENIADLYLSKGKKIFPQRNIFESKYRIIKQIICKGKYSNNELKKELVSLFGNLKMKDSNTLLCIPSYNLLQGMPRVFKFPHREGDLSMDGELLMSDVALSTSAAPTFLPIIEVGKALYVDGGLWGNNPSLVGLIEALEYFVGEGKDYSTYSILSIGSVNELAGWIPNQSKAKSILGWNSKLLKAIMAGQEYSIDYSVKKLSANIKPKCKYFRLPNPELSPEQVKIIGLDKASNEALMILQSYGDSIGNHYKISNEIKQFFINPKTYQTNNGKL